MAPGSVHWLLRISFQNILLCWGVLPTANHRATFGPQMLICQVLICDESRSGICVVLLKQIFTVTLKQIYSFSFSFFSFLLPYFYLLWSERKQVMCAIVFWLSHAYIPFVLFVSKSSRLFNRFLILHSVANKEERFLVLIFTDASNYGLFYLTICMRAV